MTEHEYLFGTSKGSGVNKIIDTKSQQDFPTLAEEMNAKKNQIAKPD